MPVLEKVGSYRGITEVTAPSSRATAVTASAATAWGGYEKMGEKT